MGLFSMSLDLPWESQKENSCEIVQNADNYHNSEATISNCNNIQTEDNV